MLHTPSYVTYDVVCGKYPDERPRALARPRTSTSPLTGPSDLGVESETARAGPAACEPERPMGGTGVEQQVAEGLKKISCTNRLRFKHPSAAMISPGGHSKF